MPVGAATSSPTSSRIARGAQRSTSAASRACLGPITQAGCGALCPKFHRGCYGCYGPAAQGNSTALADWYLANDFTPQQLVPLLRNFNANAPEFRDAGDRIDPANIAGEQL